MELLQTLLHPVESLALVIYRLRRSLSTSKEKNRSKELSKCYEYLGRASKSYAAFIRVLDGEIRDAVCIWYLILRALDTIEDDMSISIEEKLKLLPEFYRFLEDPTWKYEKSTDKDRFVLEEFQIISSQFRQLKPLYRKLLADVCHEMGTGMAIYLTKPIDSIMDWEEYCHYVAGIVGIGLSRLFSGSGRERPEVAEDTDLSDSIALFIQKADMIRDYLEDVLKGRQFWPRQVWGRYCSQLLELSSPQRIADALTCLNELITNALLHIPDVLKYLSRIRNQSIFEFCAIPQIERKIPTSEESAVATRRAVSVALMACSPSSVDDSVNSSTIQLVIFTLSTILVAAIIFCYVWDRAF